MDAPKQPNTGEKRDIGQEPKPFQRPDTFYQHVLKLPNLRAILDKLSKR